MAIVAFCLNDQCSFVANTNDLFKTEKECAAYVFKMEDHLNRQGIEITIPGCIPVRVRSIAWYE